MPDWTRLLGGMARVATDVSTRQLGLYGSVLGKTTRTLTARSAVQRTTLATLAGYGRVATDVSTRSLGGLSRVQDDAEATLGLLASVSGFNYQRLFLGSRVQRTATVILGGRGAASKGPVFNMLAGVAGGVSKTLGLRCGVGKPSAAPTGSVWPTAGRAYAKEETDALKIVYRNYPLPSGVADLVWVIDGTYLPVNAARLELSEPVKETIVETVAARVVTVVEEEFDSPRVTRNRKFTLEMPALGIQFYRWLRVRMRTGQQFPCELQLFDPKGTVWEALYTDASDPAFGYRQYWGSLPSWKVGTVRLRKNGVLIRDSFQIDHRRGLVTMNVAQGSGDLIEAQYDYQPLVQIVEVDANVKAGRGFPRFPARVVLLEVPPPRLPNG